MLAVCGCGAVVLMAKEQKSESLSTCRYKKLVGKEEEARKREWTRGRLEGRSGKGRELHSPPERMTDALSTRVHRQQHQPTRIVAQQHTTAIRVVR
mgnify:CR=1 FL=1